MKSLLALQASRRAPGGGARAAAAALLLGMLIPAAAQEEVGLETAAPLDIDALVEDTPEPRVWDVRLGVLGAVGPDYEGSGNYEFDGVPYLRVAWHERIIFRGRSLDGVLLRGDGLRAGATVRTRGRRREDEGSVLDGLGDVDRAFEAGAFASWRRGPLQLRADLAHDVAGAHDGMVADLGAALRVPFDVPWFSVRVSTTWVDDDFMSAFYGISAAQSARSGVRRFDADAGFKDVSVRIGSRLDLTEHVSALLTIGYKRLLGDAADSPIVADHGERNQYLGAIGALYRF